VASLVLTAYFPCAASFVILLREFGVADMLKASAIVVTVAFATGAVLYLTPGVPAHVGGPRPWPSTCFPTGAPRSTPVRA
jgi:hypothetical protein